jgi:molecular chaperone GrpE
MGIARVARVTLTFPLLIDYLKSRLSQMKKTEETTPTTTETAATAADPGTPPPTDAAPATPVLTPEQLTELQTKAAKADEHWERLLRTTADFDNYKKRAAREKQDAIKYANESLVGKIIPVLDNFEMALAAAQSSSADGLKSLQDGVAMIQTQLKAVLVEAGLEDIDATGKPFDPNLHEAVSQQESKDVADGHVLQQLRKGYKLRERLLRPATVIVAKQPAA